MKLSNLKFNRCTVCCLMRYPLKVQDESLTFRRSCREGICEFSDGVKHQCKNGLACLLGI